MAALCNRLCYAFCGFASEGQAPLVWKLSPAPLRGFFYPRLVALRSHRLDERHNGKHHLNDSKADGRNRQ